MWWWWWCLVVVVWWWWSVVGYTWVPSLVSSAGSADVCRRPHSPQKGPRRAAPQSMQKFWPGAVGADGWPLLT